MMWCYYVEIVCIMDDFIDLLEYYIRICESGFEIKMFFIWCLDKVMVVEVFLDFCIYIEKLLEISEIIIFDYNDMILVLCKCYDYFVE